MANGNLSLFNRAMEVNVWALRSNRAARGGVDWEFVVVRPQCSVCAHIHRASHRDSARAAASSLTDARRHLGRRLLSISVPRLIPPSPLPPFPAQLTLPSSPPSPTAQLPLPDHKVRHLFFRSQAHLSGNHARLTSHPPIFPGPSPPYSYSARI